MSRDAARTAAILRHRLRQAEHQLHALAQAVVADDPARDQLARFILGGTMRTPDGEATPRPDTSGEAQPRTEPQE